jgi:hypothetical protein
MVLLRRSVADTGIIPHTCVLSFHLSTSYQLLSLLEIEIRLKIMKDEINME